MTKFLLVSILCVHLVGCSDTKSDNSVRSEHPNSKTEDCDFIPFKKAKALNAYFNQEELQLDVQNGDTIIFIPLGSCPPCVTITLDAAIVNSFSGTVVIGDRENDFPEFTQMLTELKEQTNCVKDINTLMYQYDIDLFGPTIFIKTKNDGYKYFQLDAKNWSCIAKKMNWKLSPTKLAMNE